MLITGIRVGDGVKLLYSQNPEYRQMERLFPTRKTCEASLISLLASFKGSRGEFARTFGRQFDAWRIGLCMWFMWDDLLQSFTFDFKNSALYSQEGELLRKVMGGLTDFDPRTRLTMAAALRMLDPNNRIA